MDRVLREERAYILEIVKQIKKAGCNVLLIQKSILRDALSDLAIHFFDKMKVFKLQKCLKFWNGLEIKSLKI